MIQAERYVIGVDYGTLSGRAVVVRVRDGAELASSVLAYPHAVMDETLASTGAALPPEWALQDPADYIEVLRIAVPAAVATAGIDAGDVIGIATDFTACTVLPVTSAGVPLSMLAEYAGRPHAYVKLWRHHSAQGQADRINALATRRGESWLPRYGGLISAEWEFAKGLQLLEEEPELYARTDHWAEAADWIVWRLTGRYIRNACTAGYKGLLQDGRYPSRDFLGALNAEFAGFAEEKLAGEIGELGARAGALTAEAALWTGLREGTPVAVGNVDAHVTAPAARAVEPGQMVAIMGTSTCHVMNGSRLVTIPGICGVVDGGIVSGLFGYEAGQSGVGDIFAWYVENQVPARYQAAAQAAGVSIHEYLTDLGDARPDVSEGLIAAESQAIRRARDQVAAMHTELVRSGLVVWTAGNVSGRVPGEHLLVIKPSGVDYDDLAPENMILCTLDGAVVPNSPGCDRTPSSDTAAHAYVYRNMPQVGGVVHTHSTYATAWAARGEPIPCVITAMADEFGGDIPVGPFATIGDDSIGRGIVTALNGHRSRAVLMQNHGVFTIGADARDAIKAAVMAEDVARTVHIARQGGPLVPIPPEAIDCLFDRYQNAYGQNPEGALSLCQNSPPRLSGTRSGS